MPTVPVAQRLPSRLPNVYAADGTWCGFFVTVPAAQAWCRRQARSLPGGQFTITFAGPPPRTAALVSVGRGRRRRRLPRVDLAA